MSNLLRPNRPDALGYWEDSQVDKKSKYVDAVERLVSRLRVRSKGVREQDIRGKRRLRKKPQDASNTIRVYLKALELFTYWMQAKYNRELDPDEVTRRIAMEFMEWMRGTDPPDIRGMIVRASGMDSWMIYDAVEKSAKNRQVSIQEIYEMMPPSLRLKLVPIKSDNSPDYTELHRRLGLLIRQYKWIIRIPNSVTIRKEQGRIWTKKERDPLIYRYMVPSKRTRMSPGSVATYLSGLSATWSEMLKEDAGPDGEAPLRVNVWKEPARISLRDAREDRKRSKRETLLTHQLCEAIFRASAGPNIESLRDTLALFLMTHQCLRSEELVGALRKDLYEKDGMLVLSIRSGKGDKTREIPLDSETRDAIVGLDHAMQKRSQEQEVDKESGELVPTYWARYCAALLTNINCPLVPSLPRWGTNERKGVEPEKAALETLDTSGLRRMLCALSDRARVVDVSSGVARPLNNEERCRVHAHNFRHYGATCAREAGMPLDEIQALLGHKSVNTTEGYVHIEPQASILIGAYISRARRGQVMSSDEAHRMRAKKFSLLDDASIIASEPEERKVAIPTIGGERPQHQPRAARVVPSKPVMSPDWAYQKGGDKLLLYLPEVNMSAHQVPKGQGSLLTYRIGYASRLPWWMGRKNTWTDSEMAPILSHFQTQPESEPHWQVLRGLQDMYQEFWYDKGPTAARALVNWIDEIIHMASKQFALTMLKRGDSWIDYRASAMAGELGVVREHDADKILDWFRRHAAMSRQPVVRRPYNWQPISGPVETVDTHSFRVADTKDNFKAFMGGPAVKFQIVVTRKGEGTGRLAWFHGQVSAYSKGLVTLTKQSPKIQGKIHQLQWADVTTWGTQKETNYPALVAMEDLPSWFFETDPLMSLPDEERAAARKWIEQIQGVRKSEVRTTIIVDDLLRSMELWGMYAKAKKLEPEDKDARKMYQMYQDKADQDFQKAISTPDRFGKGVTLPPVSIYNLVGKASETAIAKMEREINELIDQGIPEEDARNEVSQAHPDLEEPEPETMLTKDEAQQPGPKSLNYKRRLVIYLKSQFGIDIAEAGALKAAPILRTRVFAPEYIHFNDKNTIEHDRIVKDAFWKAHGTDSECVVRRIIRELWERHKTSAAIYGPDEPEHHDMIRRHYYALIAYAVPCPAAIEAEIRKIRPLDLTGHSAAEIRDKVAQAWKQAMLLTRSDLGELAEKAVHDPELARQIKEALGVRVDEIAEAFEEAQGLTGSVFEQQLEGVGAQKEASKAETEKFKKNAPGARRARPNFSEAYPDLLPDPVMLAFAERWVT